MSSLDAIAPLREWDSASAPGLRCLVRQGVTGALFAEVWGGGQPLLRELIAVGVGVDEAAQTAETRAAEIFARARDSILLA